MSEGLSIHAISDLHGHIPKLPGGDLLILAGDLTRSGNKYEMESFSSWTDALDYKEIVVIAGNHDQYLTQENPFKRAHYLCDSGIELFGLKIWGSPYTPEFQQWYFMKNRGEQIKKHWDLIPDDTDILITHGPPFSILDMNMDGQLCGCEELLNVVDRVQPEHHIFGHIHEQGGKEVYSAHTTFHNVSHCDESYIATNEFKQINIGENE